MDAVTARSLLDLGRRITASLAIAVLIGLPGLALGTASEPSPDAGPPKVVIVVGPAGSATDGYRRLGREAAEAARGVTPDVTLIVSPDATWPVVRDALQGADLVVYLGHGNGWPSPYRDRPFPQTQNGLGLNPVAGGDDDAHQYFGEAYLRASVRLAPGAVVVLSHLCYASGNSEPGDPEPTREVAIQRADNFAAGWLAIGAEAVIADARLQPAFYVRRLLEGRLSPARIWLRAPSARGHALGVASVRTPGAVVLLDPDDLTAGGWYRSLVTRAPGRLQGIAWLGEPVATEAAGPTGATDPLVDTFLEEAPRIDPPEILGGQAPAGTSIVIRLPIGWRTPLDVRASVRWSPLELDDPGRTRAADPAPASGADPVESGAPGSAPERSLGDPTTPSSPNIVLVAPEVPSQVVEPVAAVAGRDGLQIETRAPERPGRYRLVVVLHRPDGSALPSEVQARIPSSVVRVTGRISVAFAVPTAVEAFAGQVVPVPIAVRNSGTVAWGDRDPAADDEVTPRTAPDPPRLVVTWLGLGAPWAGRADPGRVIGPLAPGEEVALVLLLRAPDTPGPYLVLLDVDSSAHGSLVAAGSEPGLVRVVVLDRSSAPSEGSPPADGPIGGPIGGPVAAQSD